MLRDLIADLIRCSLTPLIESVEIVKTKLLF